jgi:hypothetical protein
VTQIGLAAPTHADPLLGTVFSWASHLSHGSLTNKLIFLDIR